MTLISYDNVRATIRNLPSYLDPSIDQALSFKVKGAFFMPLYKSGRWDGVKHLYRSNKSKDSVEGSFSTGLISRVIATCQQAKPPVNLQIEDLREKPTSGQSISIKEPFVLHDYENEAVELASLASRGIFRLPTGAGKTIVQAAILGRLNVPALIVSHRLDILTHIKETTELILGVSMGIIQGPTKDIRHFNVGMVQTINACFENPKGKEAQRVVDFVQNDCLCLSVDETHHIQADTYARMMNKAKNAYYRFGFSATPYRGDGSDMLVEASLGKLQMSISPSDLVEQKRIAKPYVFFIDYGDNLESLGYVDKCYDCGGKKLQEIEKKIGKARKVKMLDGTEEEEQDSRFVYQCLNPECGKEWTVYAHDMMRHIVKNEARNKALVNIVYQAFKRGRSSLVAVNYIEHGKELARLISEKIGEDKTAFVQGKTDNRKEILEKLGKKELMCVIATTVFGEGVNCPSLDMIVCAKASDSTIDTIQVVGRGLRRAPGKFKAVIIDFIDKSKYFHKRSAHRRKLISQEKRFYVKTLRRS